MTATSSDNFKETLKQQADIVRIVGDYVKLKKAGARSPSRAEERDIAASCAIQPSTRAICTSSRAVRVIISAPSPTRWRGVGEVRRDRKSTRLNSSHAT